MVGSTQASRVELGPSPHLLLEHPALHRARPISTISLLYHSGKVAQIVIVVFIVTPMLLRIEALNVTMRRSDWKLEAGLVLVDGLEAIRASAQGKGSDQVMCEMVMEAALEVEEDMVL